MVAEMIALLMGIAHTPIGLALTFLTDCAAVFYGFKDIRKAVR